MTSNATGKEARARSRAQAAATTRKRSGEFPTRVKPVSNAISILRQLGQSQKPGTVTQLARQLAINPSTCFNILRTLAWEGLIDFDQPSKSYSIGLGVVKLAEGALTEGERIGAFRPKLRGLAERHGVTILLWRRVGNDRMLLVAVENSSADLQIHLRTGQRLPLLLGATGRAVATHLGLTKQQLREKFRALRWARRLSFEEYWRDAQESRERRWAIDNGYFATGAVTVAAPVFDRSGGVSHSLVAIMFRGQHDQSAVKRISQDLVALASELADVLF
jgi:DNA-binding IclR family transcriptional regulator